MRDEWKDQYNRMIRYRERLNSYEPPNQILYFQDDLYTFFQHCYSLKDWMIYCGFKGAEEHVNKNQCLIICAALANTTKHLELNIEKPWIKARYGDEPYRFFIGTEEGFYMGSSTAASTFYSYAETPTPYDIMKLKSGDCVVINLNTNEIYNMLDLADKCIDAWDIFIKHNGQIPPRT